MVKKLKALRQQRDISLLFTKSQPAACKIVNNEAIMIQKPYRFLSCSAHEWSMELGPPSQHNILIPNLQECSYL